MMPFFAWARVNSLDFHVFLLRSVCRLSIFGAFFVEPWLQSSLGRQRISLRELISGLDRLTMVTGTTNSPQQGLKPMWSRSPSEEYRCTSPPPTLGCHPGLPQCFANLRSILSRVSHVSGWDDLAVGVLFPWARRFSRSSSLHNDVFVRSIARVRPSIIQGR